MARPRSDIRARIVQAAREQFLHDGVEGASLRTIARHAKTSIGMVYYYFPSKDDLFFALVEDAYSLLLSDFKRALEPDAPVRDRVRRLYTRIGAVSDLELSIIRLVVREVLVSSSRLDRLIRRFQRGHVPLVFAMIADGIDESSIDARLPPPLAFMCTLALGLLPQLVLRVAAERLGFQELPTGRALADQLVDVLFQGIGGARPKRQRITGKRRASPMSE